MKKQTNSAIVSLFDRIFSSKYRLLIIAGIIFICWLPVVIMMFPGTVVNDTWTQIDRFITLTHGGIINDHHPILDTLITGGYITGIAKLFGSFDLAFFSYVLLQSIVTCLVLAYSIIYAHERLSLNKNHLSVFIIIYCFFPIFPLITQTISKDAIFCWVYVLFFIQFIELVRSNGNSLKSAKPLCLFIVTIILCALTKKIGLYVISGSLIISLLFIRSAWKQVLGSILSLLMVMFGIMPFLLGLMGVEKGGLQEMFSLPFQMTARYSTMYNDATESEISVIESVLGRYEQLPEKYVPNNADPIKGGEQLGQDGDYTKYVKTWLKQGFRHPDAYLLATLDMLSGWFSLNEFKPLMNMDWHNWITESSYVGEEQTKRPPFFEKTSRLLERIYDFVYSIPIIGLPLTFVFYIAILPFSALLWLLASRQKKAWLVLVPLGLSIILGCFLSPVSDTTEGSRYLFPIVFSMPLLFMWCIYSWNNKKASN